MRLDRFGKSQNVCRLNKIARLRVMLKIFMGVFVKGVCSNRMMIKIHWVL